MTEQHNLNPFTNIKHNLATKYYIKKGNFMVAFKNGNLTASEETLNLIYPTMQKTKKVIDIANKIDEIRKNTTFKNNSSYKPIHDICRRLSIDVYDDVTPNELEISGYKRCCVHSNPKNGFFGAAYINPKEKNIIIAYRGTEITTYQDINNDLQMGRKKLPSQFYDAENFYFNVQNSLRDKVKDYTFKFTGHSLGGSLAQLMGAKHGNETVTFNAYGIGNIEKIDVNFSDNITNYGNNHDVIYNLSEHVGKTINILTDTQSLIDTEHPIIKYHYIEDMGDIKKIPDMQNLNELKDLSNNSVDIDRNGEVFVRSYTKSNGVNVSAHTRSYPEK